MTKIAALFAIPTAVVAALLLAQSISDVYAGAIGLVIVALQNGVTAYFDPGVPWFGANKT